MCIRDRITGEAVLSRENVTMISLAESPEKWAKAVFKMKEAGRIEREEAARRLDVYKRQHHQYGSCTVYLTCHVHDLR